LKISIFGLYIRTKTFGGINPGPLCPGMAFECCRGVSMSAMAMNDTYRLRLLSSVDEFAALSQWSMLTGMS
jgi:hypothetical protein